MALYHGNWEKVPFLYARTWLFTPGITVLFCHRFYYVVAICGVRHPCHTVKNCVTRQDHPSLFINSSVDRKFKLQANTIKADRVLLRCTWHHVINLDPVSYLLALQQDPWQESRADKRGKVSKCVFLTPFGKTAGIVCSRRHNGVSVQRAQVKACQSLGEWGRKDRRGKRKALVHESNLFEFGCASLTWKVKVNT